jgi:hypothetical protein
MSGRIESRIVRAYEFISNTIYYLRQGYRLRLAIRTAKEARFGRGCEATD